MSRIQEPCDRRSFLRRTAGIGLSASASVGWTGVGSIGAGGAGLVRAEQQLLGSLAGGGVSKTSQSAYQGPHVVIIRFGGGARRRESIADPATTYAPYLMNELVPRGVLFPQLEVGSEAEDTGHGQGTLNILTGRYDKYHDVTGELLGERYEAKVPTLFEYLRHDFSVPTHEALIINGEDRTQEEFYTFSNHHLFGANFRSSVLSLYRYKTYLLRQQILRQSSDWSDETIAAKRRELQEMERLDYRAKKTEASPQIESFWKSWRDYYGDSGLVNPRGDRLLTELAIRAIKTLRPKLLMVNYNDCDYVHWGNMAHYTRGIAIMDEGIRRIVETIDHDDVYRDNTVLAIVPDCGRDDSKFAAVPCQHHFNTRSSREIFALLLGTGVDRGRIVDRPSEQIEITATLGALMGVATPHAEGSVLEEAIA